jgi:hypothetical protein
MNIAVRPATNRLESRLETGEWNPAQPPIQDKPTAPGQWSIARIIEALSRPLPASMLKTRKQGGASIKYISWHQVNRILDKYALGWSWEITNTIATPDRLIVTGRLTIPAADGVIYREGTGTEMLKEDRPVMVVEGDRRVALTDEFGNIVTESRELAYGDPSSNAESMAFRRCAARFGLGLYLYDR